MSGFFTLGIFDQILPKCPFAKEISLGTGVLAHKTPEVSRKDVGIPYTFESWRDFDLCLCLKRQFCQIPAISLRRPRIRPQKCRDSLQFATLLGPVGRATH